MNPKLEVLYKEMPWLKMFADEIGDPSVVKVKRLDHESLDRWTGVITTSDDSYWMRGYFFDENGECISQIVPPRPVNIWECILKILREFKSAGVYDIVTVKEALGHCSHKDAVHYVVLFGNDINHYCQLQLYVYKMPKGIMATELLREVEEKRAKTKAQDLVTASAEVKEEISKLS